MMWNWNSFRVALVVALFASSTARAVEVELRLVPFDNEETTLDKLERSRPLTNPVSTAKGMVMERVGVETVAWARNVLLDGKPIFERYVQGKYIDRLPVARAELKAGEHVIWPGNHAFSVDKDGAITARSPELVVAGTVVKVRCYPVTVRAFRANPEEGDLPMSMRVSALPSLTIREAGDPAASGKGPKGEKPLELLPVFDKFAPLTLWLPANAAGKGYLVHPLGLTFHLTRDGVAAGAGGGATVADLRVEKNLIDVPLYAYPVRGEMGQANRVIVQGVEQYSFGPNGPAEQMTNWSPRAQPYVLQLSDVGPTIAVDGDLRSLPFKGVAVDSVDRLTAAQRMVVVEADSRHLTPNKPLRVRVRAVDTRPVSAAETALKSADGDMKRSAAQLAAATKRRSDAVNSLKSNQGQVTAKTAAMNKPDVDEDAKKALQAEVAALEATSTAFSKTLAEAAAEAEALTAKVDQLKPVVADLQAKLDAVAAANPAADAAPFAQVRPYEGGDWRDLPLTPRAAPREYDVATPDVPDGVYRLRVGVKAVDKTQRPIAAESWVTIAADRPLSAGLFTNRNRDSFYRGEGFWIGLGVLAVNGPVPAGAPVEMDLVDAANKRLPLYRQAAPAIDKQHTFIVRVEPEACLSIAAGRYRVEAKIGAAVARPFPLDIVDPEPRTHFTNLLSLKYNTLGGGGDYQRVVESGEGAEQLAGWIADLGYNAVMGMTYAVDRVAHRGAAVEQLVRERPALGPWESYYRPSGRDQFMSALLRRNIRFYEDQFTYNDTMLPRDPRVLDACERYVALETASMRHSPAFRGVSLYDEFYESSDNGGPTIMAINYAAQEMLFRARHEKEGLTSARALKALDRFAGRPPGQRDYKDLATFRTWPAHSDDEWGLFSTRMSGAAKRVMPGAFNFTMYRFWGENGGNLAPNGTPAGVFKDLDAATCVMYKDGGQGDRPVFAPMQANVLRVRDDLPVWTQLHDFSAPGLYGMHLVRQGFFALSQKVEGLTFFDIVHDPHNPSPTDHRQTTKNLIGGVTEPYGDFLVSLEQGYHEVGIYYSRQADYLAPRKNNSIPMACEGLWVACMRAGFPARFITDDQLLAGKGQQFKVIFVPGIAFEDETPPEILKELQRLVDGGKTIIVDKPSKLPIERIVRAESTFDEYDDKLGGAFPRYEDYETEIVLDRSEDTTKLLRQMLPKYVQPATESAMLFSPDWLKKGQGQYLVMSNFAPTKFHGLYKTLYQAPDSPSIRFPKRPTGAVYDVLENKSVDVKTDGDWMTLRADLRDYPGKIYAFLPAAIDRVSLQCSPRTAGGKNIDYRVEVLDAKGQPIDASFPIEVTFTDAAGAVALHINRAAAPQFTGVFRIPANAPPGSWKLKVRELISGATAEATVTVDPGGAIGAADDARAVWVRDAAQVKRFIADPTPAVVVVDQDQAWVRPQAERLAAALTKAGKPARVAKVDEVLRLPADWNNANPTLDGSRLWRGDLVQPGLFVDAPVILLGKAFESRLMEGIVRRDALVEVGSANFPGAGRAVVSWAPLAFSTKFDSLIVTAQDDAALAKGIDALLAGDAAAPEIPIRQIATVTPDPGAPLAPAAAKPREPRSLRASVSMLDNVTSIDTDPATGRTLVGTFGYGHNLFCFDPAGKLLWKQFLPEHNVHLARWYDGGKRILAATARGPWVFMLKPETGEVLRRFGATEWPDGHGYGGFWEGHENTWLQIEINAKLSQIIVGGRTGLLAVDYDGKRLWFRDRALAITDYPANAEQNHAAGFSHSLDIGPFVLSPDGARIANGESLIVGSTPDPTKPGTVMDLWAYRPMILDATTGKVTARNEDDPGSSRGWSMSWPSQSPDPIVHFESLSMPLFADGKLGKPTVQPSGSPLPGDRYLRLAVSESTVVDADGNAVWKSAADDRLFPPSLSALSPDRTRLFRCDVEGLVRCTDVTDGKTLWEYKLPFNGQVSPLADGGVIVGTTSGLVVRLDRSGKPAWTASLLDLHERPSEDYGQYLRAALRRDVDTTADVFPVGRDAPGDYDRLLRTGIEQLKNNSFESADAWSSADGPIKTDAPGKDGGKALDLPPNQLVTQRLAQRIIPQGTYLLEFWYQAADPGATVIAGAMLTGKADKQTLTATKFTGAGRPGEWQFARVAVKAMADTQTIDIGFQSENGPARVDGASFRPIRFPSANLLANAELQAIEPTFVRDIRVQYDRIPSAVRDRLMGKNHVAAYRQGATNVATIYTQEQAFLHNGRVDDLGPFWSQPPDPMGFSAVLAKPAWVSHVVLYLNNATPDNTYRFISILANDLETKLPRQVALVRGNERRFVVVRFDKPILTDSLKILPGYHGGHKECLTEVELYGPLGGPDTSAAGFPPDDDGHPMFMGGPTHAPAKLPADLAGTFAMEKQERRDAVAAYFCGPTVTADLFTFGNATGSISSIKLGGGGATPASPPKRGARREPAQHANGPTWSLASVTPTSTPGRYAGCVLVGSADYQLHAVSDQGVYLWGFKTGGRVYSSPLPSAEDVYFGSDDGKIYKVDLHSGMLLWEFATGDRVRSSPAMAGGKIFAASWDGFLYAIDAESGQLAWKSPLAKFTRGSPAVAADKVYVGDESGQMLCFNAATGAPVWKRDLGGYISACPLVTPDGALFVSEQGDAALVAPDGSIKWKRNLGARVTGQPFATKTQALIPTSEGLTILKRATGEPDASVQGITEGQVVGAAAYKGKLCLIRASTTTNFEIPPRTYAVYHSAAEVWGPSAK